jgi:hypothetical protein
MMLAALVLVIAVSAADQPSAAIDRWRTGEPVMQRYVPVAVAPSDAGPPPNLVAPLPYLALIETMLQRSPTFRRQCARIAAEPQLTVAIERGLPSDKAAAAETRVMRGAGGRRHAAIRIWHQAHLIELIAHELEHVIEQLDGVDLPARAAGEATGVYEHADNRFETRRAALIGRKVAREVGDRR